jgi:hypothetical protein
LGALEERVYVLVVLMGCVEHLEHLSEVLVAANVVTLINWHFVALDDVREGLVAVEVILNNGCISWVAFEVLNNQRLVVLHCLILHKVVQTYGTLRVALTVPD